MKAAGLNISASTRETRVSLLILIGRKSIINVVYTKYNIGYTAGSANSNVSLSAFYSKTDGVTIATGDEKFGFRLNSDVTRGKFKWVNL